MLVGLVGLGAGWWWEGAVDLAEDGRRHVQRKVDRRQADGGEGRAQLLLLLHLPRDRADRRRAAVVDRLARRGVPPALALLRHRPVPPPPVVAVVIVVVVVVAPPVIVVPVIVVPVIVVVVPVVVVVALVPVPVLIPVLIVADVVSGEAAVRPQILSRKVRVLRCWSIVLGRHRLVRRR